MTTRMTLAMTTLALVIATVCTPANADSYRVFGTIATDAGDPVAGVRVSVSGADEVAITDSRGEYEVADVPAGSVCTVKPSHPGYSFDPKSREVTITSGDEWVNFAAVDAQMGRCSATVGGGPSDKPSALSIKGPTVTYPNAAGITWNHGDDYTITWQGFTTANVRIQLWKGWALDSTITTGTPNDGSYTWTVPTSVALGNDYLIRVSETGTGWTPDFSDNEFTVAVRTNPKVTYPDATGITWIRGDDYTITWQNFSTTNVRIQLWKNWSLVTTISTGTPNDGSYTWTVPTGTAIGSDYLIRVSETGTGWTPDFSDDEFAIVAGTANPKVTYPDAAGITWIRGDDYTITWQDFTTTNVRIQLWKGGSLDSTITTGTPNDGSYTWTVPTETAIGSDYMIRVSETGTGWTPDFSNNPFAISAGAGNPKVTYPDAAGITWTRGDDYTITWQDFASADVRIQVWKGGALYTTVTSGTPNDGSYTLTVPVGTAIGSDYLVRVSETGTSWTPDFSNNEFTVVDGGGGGITRRAVCVGISDYVGSGSDLNYCDDDAEDFAAALAASGNWDAGNITTILDRQATAANIWAALNAMSAASDADDQCVFFFSGHGGWGADQPPADEPNNRDEYLCESNLANNIYDDALGQWVTDLPTTNVFVVLCACFSGGFIKGENSVKCISGAQPGGAGEGFAAKIQSAMDAKFGALKDIDDAAAGVTLTACDFNETCQESGTLQHDVFNHYVLQAMGGAGDANSDGTITAEEIFAYAAPRATNFNSSQHAQIYDADPGQDFVLLY